VSRGKLFSPTVPTNKIPLGTCFLIACVHALHAGPTMATTTMGFSCSMYRQAQLDKYRGVWLICGTMVHSILLAVAVYVFFIQNYAQPQQIVANH